MSPTTPETPKVSIKPMNEGRTNSSLKVKRQSILSSEAEREQALRDYKVTIEYKHLKQHAPSGVYILPSFTDFRLFFGVIFLRRGLYMNGVFKFQITLPPNYNDVNAHPEITFATTVYHPHVNVETGVLDLKAAYPTWDPHKHYLVTILTFLKKMFYIKSFGDDAVANVEARELSRTDPAMYKQKVDSCVRESQKLLYVNDPGCTIKFKEENPCHALLRDIIRKEVGNDVVSVSRDTILECVQQATSQGHEASLGKGSSKEDGNEK